jgi:hypothetical protein
LEDRRNFGESSCNSGDVTDQRVQSLMLRMMMMIMMIKHIKQKVLLNETDFAHCVTKIKTEFDNKQIFQDGGIIQFSINEHTHYIIK